MTYLLQLNASLYPRVVRSEGSSEEKTQAWELGSHDIEFSGPVTRLRELLKKLEAIIDEAPPDPGPRRFGNISFRKWFKIVETRLPDLLTECLPGLLAFEHPEPQAVQVGDELRAYLIGSFGSSQRLDYGTGHELSFLAFLACIWMLGGFTQSEPGVEERGIVFGVIEPYLDLIRRLIKTYTLEPAGSHGVWGLDDHSFLPYIFGSAQLCPPLSSLNQLSSEGSLFGAPDPGGVAKDTVVQRERKRNMYFSAVGFIYDVKKGPFWEHSPYLFDISGVRGGWAKINKGMIKMYDAEVLSKFPVVQHFPFGSLFSWDRDPDVKPPPPSTHTSSQPTRSTSAATYQETHRPVRREAQEEMKAPWAVTAHLPTLAPQTAAPWANMPSAEMPTATTSRARAMESPRGSGEVPLRTPRVNRGPPTGPPVAAGGMQAPWVTTATVASKSNNDGEYDKSGILGEAV
ncbi:MAG: Serine/threonine-protein phosphatase 2A activator 1 [Trichoglossum hirsutum]|nr:MAG: Serine/threonine-protein phosphatase 2A activator 1 [Trichoglossum hirsutum]